MQTFAKDLQTVRQRIDRFYESLPSTDIWYVFFTRKGDPKVRTKLGSWSCEGGIECFVAPGASSGWCYVYMQSTIAYLVCVHTNNDAMIVTEDQFEKDHFSQYTGTTVGVANHGDHITIGIDPKIPNEIVLKTHATLYTEMMRPDVNHKRDDSQICNISLTRYPAGVTSESVCLPRSVLQDAITTNRRQETVGSQYNMSPFALGVISRMSKIALGIHQDGGSVYTKYHGRRYKVRVGPNGGKYIQIANGVRRYLPRDRPILQKGGNPLSYKTVVFADDFIAYLRRYAVDPVFDVRSDLESAILIFDERAQLGRNSNRYIVCLYDFEEDHRHIFYIDALKALIGFFASTHQDTATPEERANHAQFVDMSAAMVARMAAVHASP